jgi:hypothetical protein
MRAYLAIAANEPGQPVPSGVLGVARRAIATAVPVPTDQWRHREWLSPRGDVALLAWSNEPELDPFPEPIRRGPERVLGYCGYLGDPCEEDSLLKADALGHAVDSLGGVFSVFRASTEGIEAATSISRACPVYYTEAAGLRVVGSRAILVHLTARAAETKMSDPAPHYDILGLHAMMRHGFYVSDETPFQDVFALPNAGVFTAQVGQRVRVTSRPLPAPQEMPRDRAEARRMVEPLAEALLAACEPFRRHDQPVRLALSGGRDSRLIAAALYARGIPMIGAAHGLADDPDVVLSERVARLVGAEWTCDYTTPAQHASLGASVTVGHPLLRAYDVVRMCEGMNSGYEGVNAWAPYDRQPRSSGSGGERLRGGFLTDTADLSPAGVERRVRVIFRAQDRLLTPAANARARPHHERWLEQARTDPDGGLDVLDKLHMFYRTGRWLAGSHTATLMNWPYYHPFLDARVVRAALALPARWRLTEEPVYMLIDQLAPQLIDVPFDAKRWRFETRRPLSPRRWRAWKARAPLPPGATSTFNWRRHYGADFAALMREHILAAPPELSEVVDMEKIRLHLSQVPPRRPSQTWHLLTLSVLLSGLWLEARPRLPDVDIPIPRPAGGEPGA